MALFCGMASKTNSLLGGLDNWRDYFVQVSLILLSLLIATSIDRWREQQKDDNKKGDYLTAILHDLREEHAKNETNLFDCKNDIRGLTNGLRLLQSSSEDSLEVAILNLVQVYGRGVFRTFSPTTFDVMTQTGDLTLIRDLELRDDLARAFSFRNKVIQKDLEKYDLAVVESLTQLGRYINLSCVLSASERRRCIMDVNAFLESPHNEITMLLLEARNRALHLENATRMYPPVIEAVEKELGIA